MRFGQFMAAVGACLAVTGIATSAVTTATHTSYALRPCSTCKEVVYPTEVECRAAAQAEARRVGETRTTGSAVYTCITRHNVIATFQPAPIALPPVDCAVSDWGPPTDPAWLGCTDARQTRAVIRIRSIVTQPANGGASCPALTETTTQTRTCALLTWTPPTTNTDGTAIANLTGYRIVYGRSPSELVQSVDVAPSAREHTLPDLSSGAWYFSSRTLAGGNQSALSAVVTRVIP